MFYDEEDRTHKYYLCLITTRLQKPLELMRFCVICAHAEIGTWSQTKWQKKKKKKCLAGSAVFKNVFAGDLLAPFSPAKKRGLNSEGGQRDNPPSVPNPPFI